MATLNYKSSNIMKAEKETGLNFISAVQSLQTEMGIYTIYFLLKAGGLDDDKASELIDAGIDTALIAIMEGIGEAGFLPEATRVQVKASLAQAKKQMAEASAPSQTTGDKTQA